MSIKIEQHRTGEILTMSLTGNLDTITAPELDKVLHQVFAEDTTKTLILDCTNLIYLSSAGLRVILTAQKTITKIPGTMILRNVQPSVMEVFEITGFSDFLTFEKI